ncbi:MAG: SDR family NAD(P)-dependent oxidoreductase [Sphingomonadaceae bacterium]|nr:SDR family NAD(P)-dependent oxidoreductase [Sphingomonadaceae bacterium]
MDLAKYGPWALVTGGSEGIGAAAARQLAADGFKLVLVARKPAPLEELKAELEAGGAQVRIKSVDLSADDALDQVRSVTDDIEVGLMFYNAGANNQRGNFVDLPREVTQQVIALNVLGHADFSRHYGKLMCDRGRGGIVLTGSTGGYTGSATIAAYSASKAFCRVLAEALWLECAPHGVDVCHLALGFTATPAMERLGLPVELAETCEEVARQGLANIANGPIWVVDTKGTLESAREMATFDNRAEIVRKFTVPPREDTGKG